MLKAKQIPDEAYEAASRIEDKNDIGAVILAALNAWPGMEIEMVGVEEDYLILPLNTENNNDKV
jgi:hypothetical protein